MALPLEKYFEGLIEFANNAMHFIPSSWFTLNNVIDVENGDTLHLVERQPQPSTGSSSGEATSNNGVRGCEKLQSCDVGLSVFKKFPRFVYCFLFLSSGQDSAGGPRHRIGPVAHSIVLGTLNVGDPGEAVVPDISRVCPCCYAWFAN